MSTSPSPLKFEMKYAKAYAKLAEQHTNNIRNTICMLLIKNGVPFLDDTTIKYEDNFLDTRCQGLGKYRITYNQDFTIKAQYFIGECPLFCITLTTMGDRFVVVDLYMGVCYNKLTNTVINFEPHHYDVVNEIVRKQTMGTGSLIELTDSPYHYTTTLPIECLAPMFKEVLDSTNYEFGL